MSLKDESMKQQVVRGRREDQGSAEGGGGRFDRP